MSYRHETPVLDWGRNHFFPLLRQRLPAAMPATPRIFIDEDSIEKGARWPATLRKGLKTAKCMVAIWTPEYFRSSWCLTEWHSMRDRETQLGLDPARAGLIYPIVFADGQHFPQEAKDTQSGKDFTDWNYPHAVFRQSTEYLKFDRAVQQLCQELADMIQRAPAWQQDFPVTPKNAVVPAAARLPRL